MDAANHQPRALTPDIRMIVRHVLAVVQKLVRSDLLRPPERADGVLVPAGDQGADSHSLIPPAARAVLPLFGGYVGKIFRTLAYGGVRLSKAIRDVAPRGVEDGSAGNDAACLDARTGVVYVVVVGVHQEVACPAVLRPGQHTGIAPGAEHDANVRTRRLVRINHPLDVLYVHLRHEVKHSVLVCAVGGEGGESARGWDAPVPRSPRPIDANRRRVRRSCHPRDPLRREFGAPVAIVPVAVGHAVDDLAEPPHRPATAPARGSSPLISIRETVLVAAPPDDATIVTVADASDSAGAKIDTRVDVPRHLVVLGGPAHAAALVGALRSLIRVPVDDVVVPLIGHVEALDTCVQRPRNHLVKLHKSSFFHHPAVCVGWIRVGVRPATPVAGPFCPGSSGRGPHTNSVVAISYQRSYGVSNLLIHFGDSGRFRQRSEDQRKFRHPVQRQKGPGRSIWNDTEARSSWWTTRLIDTNIAVSASHVVGPGPVDCEHGIRRSSGEERRCCFQR